MPAILTLGENEYRLGKGVHFYNTLTGHEVVPVGNVPLEDVVTLSVGDRTTTVKLRDATRTIPVGKSCDLIGKPIPKCPNPIIGNVVCVE